MKRIFLSAKFHYLLFFPLIFLSLAVDAKSISRDVVTNLSKSPTWLKLIYFENQRSEVRSDQFYLAENGRDDPLAELQKTMEAMMAPLKGNHNEHAQCRFRGRYYWLLEKEVFEGFDLPKANCDEYYQWSNEDVVKSVSMIFATGYLSNPASFYGHMLLKFNGDTEAKNNLLDKSINYGAVVPPNENPIIYILKGLFGGYDARYSDGDFYQYNHNYTNIDQRDIWEYELDLSEKEIKLLLAHTWELLGQEFSYFYLTKNCGYRIAEMIETVLDGSILPREEPWVMPVEIYRELSTYQHKGKPLVKNIKRNLSKQNLFYEKLDQLSLTEKRHMRQIAADARYLKTDDYVKLDASSKIKVVDVLLDYSELSMRKTDEVSVQEFNRLLLSEMLSLSQSAAIYQWEEKLKQSPHVSQKPSLVRLGYLNNSESGSGWGVNLRPAYFDMLTPQIGIMPYSKLYMLNLEIENRGNGVKLKQFDLVDIETLNLPRSGLSGDRRNAWKLSFGWDRSDFSCEDCLSPNVEAGIGDSLQPFDDVVLYGFLEGRAQYKKEHNEHFAAGVELGSLIVLYPEWKMQLLYRYRDYIDFDNKNKHYFKVENRFGISQNWDVRLRYEKQKQSEFVLSTAYYFQ